MEVERPHSQNMQKFARPYVITPVITTIKYGLPLSRRSGMGREQEVVRKGGRMSMSSQREKLLRGRIVVHWL